MGKGDKKTGRGKRNAGSYGKTRLRRSTSALKIPVKVLDDDQKEASKSKVRRELPPQTAPTENADVKPKKTAAKTKKTEE